MTRILILGGYGLTGKALARHLLEQSGVEVVIAGRALEKARDYAGQLNAEFGGLRATARRLDAASGRDLHEALKDVDLLLVAAPTTQHANKVIYAALESGVDYLDVQFNAGKLALLKDLALEIKSGGYCFITEAGFHPGLPAVIVRHAATQLDRLDTALVAGYLNLGRALPYSDAVDELVESFRDYQGQVFENHEWTKPNEYKIREVDFGGEIGVRKSYSLFFEELRDLPHMLPTMRELGFYMAGTHWIVDWVCTPLVMAGLKVPSARLTHALGKLLWWSMQTFARPPYAVMIHLRARGERNGSLAEVIITASHTDAYELTAIPVVACLLQYLDGSARRPGLWMMGHLVDPARFFQDMERMGVRVCLSSAVVRD